MITEERRAEIVLEIQKESISLEMVRGLNLEELLFFIRTLQGADGGVDQVLIDQLISKAKGYDSWYIVNFKEFPVPFIRGGKAYMFTDEDAGKTAVERFEKRGLPVELYRHPLYAEDIFERIIRYGAEGVSINRGGLGLILNADLFSSDIEWSGKELNLAIIELILSVNEEDEAQEKAEKVFSDALRMAELYYAAAQTNNPRNADPMIEKSYSEGREHDCVYVFSDRQELKEQYPRFSTIVKSMKAGKLFDNVHNVEFVLNPMSANIILGEGAIAEAIEYAAYYERVLQETKKLYEDTEQAEAVTRTIMEYDDIRMEFLSGLSHDGFEFPTEGMVSVDGYTAEVLQKTAAQNHMDAYAMLAQRRATMNRD